MIQSLSLEELSNQFTEQHLKQLDKFFTQQAKYSYRHQRLIHLLEQLKRSIDDYNNNRGVVVGGGGGGGGGGNIGEDQQQPPQTTSSSPPPLLESPSTPTVPSLISSMMKSSPSIDFFMLYLNNNTNNKYDSNNLDKEWYYNIVNSACSYSTQTTTTTTTNSPNDLITDSSSLKSKQCALMLSNLDLSNILSILSGKQFKLNILRECILLSAHRTQLDIQKLPSALKQAAMSGNNLSLQNDFMHPLWLASSQCLFDLLRQLVVKLPEPPSIVFNFNE